VAFEAGLPLSMGQYLSLPLIALGLGIVIWVSRSPGARKKA
jgi:prolipoprotein diacylglyceryltransferase